MLGSLLGFHRSGSFNLTPFLLSNYLLSSQERFWDRLLAEAGHLQEALALALDAVKLNPNTFKVWATLGRIRFEMGDYKTACDAYRRGQDLEPRDAELALCTLFVQATCEDRAFRNGKQARDGAKLLCERLRGGEPGRIALLVLAAAQAESGDFQNALAVVDDVLREKGVAPATVAGAQQLRSTVAQKRPYYYVPLGKGAGSKFRLPITFNVSDVHPAEP